MTTVRPLRAERASLPEQATRLTFPSALAYLAAGLFMVASGGANLIHGVAKATDLASAIVWGAVSIAVTIGAALSWPAFVAAIDARKIGRASLAAIGILVFTAYSIVAALGSAAGARMDAAGSERASIERRERAKADHTAVERELAALPPARGEAELRPQIATLQATPGANRCEKRDGDISRRTCARVDELETEIARAARRGTLETRRDAAARILGEGTATRTANADAKALAGFLAALGFGWDEDRLNKVLVLLAVIVVEIGGGVSLALAASLRARPATVFALSSATLEAVAVPSPAIPAAAQGEQGAEQAPVANPVACPETRTLSSQKGESTAPDETTRAKALALIVAAGGSVRSSQRELAATLGCSPSRLATVLRDLREAGAVTVRSSATGSVVALA